MSSQVFQEKRERDHSVSKAMRQHSWGEGFAPQRDRGKNGSNQNDGDESCPPLIDVPLREDRQLQDRSQPCASTKCMALFLDVAAEDEFFNETSAEGEEQKGQSFAGVVRSHGAKCGTVQLKTAKDCV